MNPKKYLANRIRGWLPREPNLTKLRRTAKRETYTAKAIGYGVGLTFFAILLTSFHLLGWYGQGGNSMQRLYDSIIFGILFGTCWAIGLLLSAQLQKRWHRC